jgi:hypothetical protein
MIRAVGNGLEIPTAGYPVPINKSGSALEVKGVRRSFSSQDAHRLTICYSIE